MTKHIGWQSSKVLAAAATGIETYINASGGDPEIVLNRVGLRPDDLAEPTRSVSLESYCTMLETAAAETRNPQFGLAYGAQFTPEMFGLIGFIALASTTAAAAFQNLAELFSHHQSGTETRFGRSGNLARLEYRIIDPLISNRPQDAEFTIAAFINIVQRCLGSGWSCVRVDFEHAASEAGIACSRLLDSEVLFGQRTNALVIRSSTLDVPMASGSPQLLDVLVSSLKAVACPIACADPIMLARSEIRRRLASGTVSLSGIADSLGMPTWTLQRRLKEGSLTFSALVDDVRKELAASYLRQPSVALSEIALLLGYSEASAFSRAYRMWHGRPPAIDRRASR